MANLIIVSGPQAVGKMTISECLRDKIGYRMMTNHDSIELSDAIFERKSSAQKEFNLLIREAAFSTAIKYDINMIFTLVIAYDQQDSIDYVKGLINKFEASGGNVYLIELISDLKTRLERNLTPHRLEMKPTKRDTEWTKSDILKTHENNRLNSYEDEFIYKNHIKINNNDLTPDEVVDIIIEKCNLNKI